MPNTPLAVPRISHMHHGLLEKSRARSVVFASITDLRVVWFRIKLAADFALQPKPKMKAGWP